MVTFNFSYAPETTLQQMIGFEMAGRVWSSFLVDPVTVNLHVGVSSSLPTNVIGGSLPGILAKQDYGSVARSLKADATSADDSSAVANLKNTSFYQAWFDEFDRSGRNGGEKATSGTLNLTRANAKALNLLSSSSDLDGIILFGSLSGSNYRWNYDFTRTSSAPTNTLDFLSTAIHEIGHILGFVSGVDKPGWLSSVTPNFLNAIQYKASLNERVTYTTPLDLFRFSTVADAGMNDLSYGSIGSDKFFSVDGGKTAIAQFSTGADTSLGGNGFQASHWKNLNNASTGIMAPALSPQQQSWISRTDLRAFDVMGWSLQSTTSALNLDLSALQSQSEQALAQQLGKTTSWLYQNATTAATSLSRDRTAEIEDMIRKSGIYGWGTKPPSTPTPPNPWQQVLGLFQSQVVYGNFDTLDELPPVAEERQALQFFSFSNQTALDSTSIKFSPIVNVDLSAIKQEGLNAISVETLVVMPKQSEFQLADIRSKRLNKLQMEPERSSKPKARNFTEDTIE